MQGLLQHFLITLRLYTRNRIALIYGYLFPIGYFLAVLAIYPHEQPRLVRHIGAVLTISILGGACMSLPTAMASERQRGVWRRYRFSPISSGSLVASTLVVRFVALLGAGIVQLVLAMLIGHWVPAHPLDLAVTFTLVAFAFLGPGLVLAMVANTATAAQALGQCIFLPMLVIGGVAVKLTILPTWALHVSAFLPGRYAVEILQACVTGDGLGAMGFHLVALFLIGAAGCLAGAKLFRWDSQRQRVTGQNRIWIAVALAAWAIVGVAAEWRHEVAPRLDHSGTSLAATSEAQPPADSAELPAPPD